MSVLLDKLLVTWRLESVENEGKKKNGLELNAAQRSLRVGTMGGASRRDAGLLPRYSGTFNMKEVIEGGTGCTKRRAEDSLDEVINEVQRKLTQGNHQGILSIQVPKAL